MKSLYYPPQVADKCVDLVTSPIDFNRAVTFFPHANTGAQVIFSGIVRQSSHNKEVLQLDYEAHPTIAIKCMAEIVEEAIQEFGITNALCIHRIGIVRPKELAVLVITNSQHRDESYKANRFIIDKVKHDVPIWKKEIFTDLTYEWGKGC